MARSSVTRTRDGGKTWESLRDGLPQRDAYDLVYRHGLDVDETGKRLVMGSTTGGFGSARTAASAGNCSMRICRRSMPCGLPEAGRRPDASEN